MYVPVRIILRIIRFLFHSHFDCDIPLGCDPSTFWCCWFCLKIYPSLMYLTQLSSPLNIIVDLWFIHYLTLTIFMLFGDTPSASKSSYFRLATTLESEVYEVSGGKNPFVCSSNTLYNLSVSGISPAAELSKILTFVPSKVSTCLCSSPSTAARCEYKCEYHLLFLIWPSNSFKWSCACLSAESSDMKIRIDTTNYT